MASITLGTERGFLSSPLTLSPVPPPAAAACSSSSPQRTRAEESIPLPEPAGGNTPCQPRRPTPEASRSRGSGVTAQTPTPRPHRHRCARRARSLRRPRSRPAKRFPALFLYIVRMVTPLQLLPERTGSILHRCGLFVTADTDASSRVFGSLTWFHHFCA